MSAIQVEVSGGEHAWLSPFAPSELRAVLTSMLRTAGVHSATVELCLTRDGDMAQANAAFMNCIGPTNILSFPESPFEDPPQGYCAAQSASQSLLQPDSRLDSRSEATDSSGSRAQACVLAPCADEAIRFQTSPGTAVRLCGSLLLSLDCVGREAELYRQSPRDHCLRLLAHGLAHLAGLDHGPEMDALCDKFLDSQIVYR